MADGAQAGAENKKSSGENVKALKKRAEKAWQRRMLYDGLLRDVYDYVLPMRDVTGLHVSQGRSEGEARVDKVFDSTATKAAYRFAGRLQTELTPLFQQFFTLEAGPVYPDGDDRKKLTEELEKIGKLIHGLLASGSYHNSSHEMYIDLYAGTCHMLILKGDDRIPVRYRVVPVPEVAIEDGPWGEVWRWYWKRRWPADQLPVLWPDGEFSPELKKLIEDKPDDEVEVCQYTYWDDKAGDYKLIVWCDKQSDDDKPFWRETFRTSPWITSRFFKVPGEAYGRGPAMMAMPAIKTTNMARELQLKAAALAIMGVWMRRADNVFNPATAKFEPLAFWDVSSTGGPLGPTVQRLPIPQDFDISSVVIADEREQMKLALFDDTLPAETSAVRSATEIAERISRLSQDLAGVYGRLTLEIVVPTVQRLIDIAEQAGLLKTSLKIDQLLTQVRVVAPIAVGQHAGKVRSAVDWVQMLGMLGGPQEAVTIAKLEDLGPEIGRWLGVEERFIRSQAEQKKMRDKRQKQMDDAAAADVLNKLPEPQAGAVPAGAV